MKKAATLLSILTVLIFISSHTQAQQRERLVAESIYLGSFTHTFQAWDSVFYIYGGSRYMDSPLVNIYYPTQAYDTAFGWNGNNNGFDTLSQKIVQTYNAAGQMVTDTIVNWNDSTQTYIYAWYDTITYNNTGLPLTVVAWQWNTVSNTWINYWARESVYDSSGRRLEYVQLQWDSGAQAWDTNTVFYWTYAGTGQISTEYQITNPNNGTGDAFLYSYDSLGRMDTTTLLRATDSLIWIANGMETYTYDSLSRMTSQCELIPDSSGWENNQRRLYSYDSTNDMVLMQTQVSEPSGWTDWIRQLYSYDAYHHDTLYIIQDTSAGQWINSIRYQAAYDSYGSITWSATTAWDTSGGGGSWAPDIEDEMFFYYYQLYTPDTTSTDTMGIASITPSGDLRIYPVPASSMLTLDLTWCDAQASTATIYDATCRRCADYPLPNTSSYHGYIPITALPDGIYTMVIKGIKGSVTKQFSVMR